MRAYDASPMHMLSWGKGEFCRVPSLADDHGHLVYCYPGALFESYLYIRKTFSNRRCICTWPLAVHSRSASDGDMCECPVFSASSLSKGAIPRRIPLTLPSSVLVTRTLVTPPSTKPGGFPLTLNCKELTEIADVSAPTVEVIRRDIELRRWDLVLSTARPGTLVILSAILRLSVGDSIACSAKNTSDVPSATVSGGKINKQHKAPGELV